MSAQESFACPTIDVGLCKIRWSVEYRNISTPETNTQHRNQNEVSNEANIMLKSSTRNKNPMRQPRWWTRAHQLDFISVSPFLALPQHRTCVSTWFILSHSPNFFCCLCVVSLYSVTCSRDRFGNQLSVVAIVTGLVMCYNISFQIFVS